MGTPKKPAAIAVEIVVGEGTDGRLVQLAGFKDKGPYWPILVDAAGRARCSCPICQAGVVCPLALEADAELLEEAAPRPRISGSVGGAAIPSLAGAATLRNGGAGAGVLR